MCRMFKTIYACGHRDVVKAPCEWRDEGRVDILGRRVRCENSTTSLADLGRLCMICSQDISGQDLIDLESSKRNLGTESYIMCDQKDVMARIVRNESYLRKRERISRVVPTPPTSLGLLTPSELHYRCCVNEEFLARRLKRRYLQQRFSNQGEYQDLFEAQKAHIDAKTALNDSIFSLRNYAQATTQFKNVQESATRTAITPTADASTQTNGLEEVVTHCQHTLPTPSLKPDEPSMTVLAPSSAGPRIPFPVDSAELDSRIGQATGTRLRLPTDRQWGQQELESLQSIRDDEEGDLILFPEVEGSDSAEVAGERAQEQFSERPGLINGLTSEVAERGMSRPDPPQAEFELDSPEGVAGLMDIRLFLGMRPDTKPLDIWNFAIRNSDLISNITGNTLPIRHRQIGEATRPGFYRDSGLDTVLDYADDKWELKEGFVNTWNSLRWSFEPRSQPAYEVPGSPMDIDDDSNEEPAIDEFCRVLILEKDVIAHGVNVDEIDAENEIGQSDDHKQQNGEEATGRTFQLEGKRARLSFEADSRGKAIAPRHQARIASPLRMCWTYADPENADSCPDWEDDVVSPPSSTSASPTLRDGNWSKLPSHPAYPTSQNAPASPLVSDILSALKHCHDDTIPTLFLGDGSTDTEGPGLPPDRGDSIIEEGISSSGSIGLRVSERKAPPSLIDPASVTGMSVLGHLRHFLAMPDSKTPQEISMFIDLHPGLMRAIRSGYVPVREAPTTLNRNKQRQQKTRATLDPMHALRATRDRKQRFMQNSLIFALERLDWDEIDSAPVPFAPWGAYHHHHHHPPPKVEPHHHRPDDDNEEEFEIWVRTTVSPAPNRLGKVHGRYMMKYRVKKPSPLRTMLTRREPKVQLKTVQPSLGETAALSQNGTQEATALAESGPSGEAGSVLSDVEVWDEVDLNASGPLPQKDT